MEPRVYYNLLHKILYCIKFRNNESFDQYVEIVFSPLYVELFKEVISEQYKLEGINDIDNIEKIFLSERPEEYSRICQIIKNSEFTTDLTDELKRELLEIIIYPFRVDKHEEEELLKLFK